MILLGNKIKIHEIAKKVGISSKDALERARLLGIEASSHLSGVEEEDYSSFLCLLLKLYSVNSSS